MQALAFTILLNCNMGQGNLQLCLVLISFSLSLEMNTNQTREKEDKDDYFYSLETVHCWLSYFKSATSLHYLNTSLLLILIPLLNYIQSDTRQEQQKNIYNRYNFLQPPPLSITNPHNPLFISYYWIVQKAQWQSSFVLSITASCNSSSIGFKIPTPIVSSPLLISIGTNVSDATSSCSWKNLR